MGPKVLFPRSTTKNYFQCQFLALKIVQELISRPERWVWSCLVLKFLYKILVFVHFCNHGGHETI